MYHNTENSAVAATQRKLKEMMNAGFIGRKKSNEGIFRYYLQTAGCYAVAQYINFEATPGHDRSFLNCSRYDRIVEKMIRDANEVDTKTGESIMLGRGALRRIKNGKFSDVDGILGVRIGKDTRMLKVYVKINAPDVVGIAKYENANKRAKQFGTKLVVVGDNFTKKSLGITK
ncbi:hypothetical protein [Herbaspirillum sp. SJZ107]|uniref:hypothetical protein n=1 Tax=Herbaspirillum sp. SJZ107 TaxID=2572881 RepID=UPI0011545A35|nr:hypothetical protein [Herbaspirillum sp. SJZ107]